MYSQYTCTHNRHIPVCTANTTVHTINTHLCTHETHVHVEETHWHVQSTPVNKTSKCKKLSEPHNLAPKAKTWTRCAIYTDFNICSSTFVGGVVSLHPIILFSRRQLQNTQDSRSCLRRCINKMNYFWDSVIL